MTPLLFVCLDCTSSNIFYLCLFNFSSLAPRGPLSPPLPYGDKAFITVAKATVGMPHSSELCISKYILAFVHRTGSILCKDPAAESAIFYTLFNIWPYLNLSIKNKCVRLEKAFTQMGQFSWMSPVISSGVQMWKSPWQVCTSSVVRVSFKAGTTAFIMDFPFKRTGDQK